MSAPPALRTILAFARREVGAVAALLAFALLTNIFIYIADEVTEGETNHLDRAVLMALRVPGRPHRPIGPHWLDMATRDFTSIGSITVLAVIVLLVAGLFVSLGRLRQAILLVLAGGGGIAVSQLIKGVVGRERPDFVFRAVEAANPSFPSGHAMLSAVVFLSMGALSARFAERRRIKTYVMAAAVLLTVLVGLSRVYLGVHWLTDVLAGWTLGAAWALLFWLAEWAFERWAEDADASRTAPDGGASGQGPGPRP